MLRGEDPDRDHTGIPRSRRCGELPAASDESAAISPQHHGAARGNVSALIVWIAATAALYVINPNMWALASLPVIFVATRVELRLPRLRHVFYVYYPLHLLVIWLVQRLL